MTENRDAQVHYSMRRVKQDARCGVLRGFDGQSSAREELMRTKFNYLGRPRPDRVQVTENKFGPRQRPPRQDTSGRSAHGCLPGSVVLRKSPNARAIPLHTRPCGVMKDCKIPDIYMYMYYMYTD